MTDNESGGFSPYATEVPYSSVVVTGRGIDARHAPTTSSRNTSTSSTPAASLSAL
uniref:Uncharacterized protein n=1 Tax=Oryza sativa subsp. indica TaxID=39946 RepID=A0A679B8U6_ORYSI|nr:hypothetical protein [Oryza sativa Indica Group]